MVVFGGLESFAPDVITSVNLDPKEAMGLFAIGCGYLGIVLNGAGK